jgi:hypothetical protein
LFLEAAQNIYQDKNIKSVASNRSLRPEKERRPLVALLLEAGE